MIASKKATSKTTRYLKSNANEKKFKSFKNKKELKKYLVETNLRIVNNINQIKADMQQEDSESFKQQKESKNQFGYLDTIETTMDKVLNKEIIRILNLKTF